MGGQTGGCDVIAGYILTRHAQSSNSTGAVSSINVRQPREDATKMSRVSGDFRVQLAMCLQYLIGRLVIDLLRCSVARLSVCRVVLQSPQARVEVNISLAFLYWVGIALHP